jgi:hypothetical protein
VAQAAAVMAMELLVVRVHQAKVTMAATVLVLRFI